VSKHCCPTCRHLLSLLAKGNAPFVIRGSHNTVTACTLPTWLPKQIMDSMNDTSGGQLRRSTYLGTFHYYAKQLFTTTMFTILASTIHTEAITCKFEAQADHRVMSPIGDDDRNLFDSLQHTMNPLQLTLYWPPFTTFPILTLTLTITIQRMPGLIQRAARIIALIQTVAWITQRVTAMNLMVFH